MSALGGLALLAATVGSGIYTEAGYDLLWSDRVSFVAQGQRVLGEFGYFHGDFVGSYGLGSSTRYGLGMSWEPTYVTQALSESAAPDQALGRQVFFPHFTLSRGVDLYRLGIAGKLRLGPAWSVAERNAFYDSDAIWGGQISAEGSVSYNVGAVFRLAPRLGLGVLIDEEQAAYHVTLGVGIHFQAPLRKLDSGKRADYWEGDY